MPINPNALSGDEPDRSAPPASAEEEGAVQAAQQQAADEDAAQEEQPKRKRRSKKEMIADAVVPADDEQVELKDAGTGAKIQRPWLVALEMVRDGKAKFTAKPLEYAMVKYDAEKVAAALEQGAAESPEEAAPAGNVAQGDEQPKSANVPPGAQVGDEVYFDDNVFRVGHDGVLTSGPISVDGEIVLPKRRWVRGAEEANAEWAAYDLGAPETPNGHGDAAAVANQLADAGAGGEVHVESQRLPRTMEPQDDGTVKIGTGVLEKIGMPEYSSFQVGPITMSRSVFDDGRRTVVTFDDGREGEVITAALEGFELLDNTVEFVAKRFRGQLISFLQATGALQQPASSGSYS
jgi:hypothetical protein